MSVVLDDPKLSEKLLPRVVETELGPVEYAEFGEGPAVVALHGAMGGYDQSVLLAQTIGRSGFRYIAVTRPGYLGTPISSGAWPEEQADLVAALLDVLEIVKTGIMGISGGGPASVQFGIRHSERCNGLILAATRVVKDPTPIPFAFKLMTKLARWPWFVDRVKQKAADDLVATARRSILDPEILDRTISDPETWPLMSTMLLSTYDRMGDRIVGTRNDIKIGREAEFELDMIQSPVLLVHGTEDRLVDYESNTATYLKEVSDCELCSVEGGDHVTIFTHRKQVRDRTDVFMQRYFK